jgi:hypothetical protein
MKNGHLLIKINAMLMSGNVINEFSIELHMKWKDYVTNYVDKKK